MSGWVNVGVSNERLEVSQGSRGDKGMYLGLMEG